MQLKDLYDDYNSENDAGRARMVGAYRIRRDEEFEGDRINYERKQRKAATKRQPALNLTDAEKALIKKMGLTQAAVRSMRAATIEENDACF